MALTAEQKEQVAAELKKIGAELNLSNDQKEKLHTALDQVKEKLAAYKAANPNVTRADLVKAVATHRDQIREKVVNFLTPEQLTKWDAAVKNAKEFLGEHLTA